jgi:hypothetical protein
MWFIRRCGDIYDATPPNEQQQCKLTNKNHQQGAHYLRLAIVTIGIMIRLFFLNFSALRDSGKFRACDVKKYLFAVLAKDQKKIPRIYQSFFTN